MGGGRGEGEGERSIKLLYFMAYQLYPRFFVYIYILTILTIHISGMTCCH